MSTCFHEQNGIPIYTQDENGVFHYQCITREMLVSDDHLLSNPDEGKEFVDNKNIRTSIKRIDQLENGQDIYEVEINGTFQYVSVSEDGSIQLCIGRFIDSISGTTLATGLLIYKENGIVYIWHISNIEYKSLAEFFKYLKDQDQREKLPKLNAIDLNTI